MLSAEFKEAIDLYFEARRLLELRERGVLGLWQARVPSWLPEDFTELDVEKLRGDLRRLWPFSDDAEAAIARIDARCAEIVDAIVRSRLRPDPTWQ